MVVSLWQMSVRPERLEIIFIDVGQGDCILLRSRDVTLMIDAGPRTDSWDSAERVVVPYLLENGIKKIDMLFITHPDADHIGGARYLLSRFPVEGVAVPALGDMLYSDAWQEGLPFEFWPEGEMVTKLTAGDCVSWGSLRVEVLAPTVLSGTNPTANSASLVLRVTYKDWSFLLTGDMEKETMQNIRDRGAEAASTFIKVPHHGSKANLDEDFFDGMNPSAVFITVGRNSYGHPTREVLEYWEERGVSVYRTDVEGTIRLIVDRDARVMTHGR
jgi:competence protein ComEC